MSRYIDADAFIAEKREQYCKECDRRKGKRNGKQTILYEIGEAPCRACGIDDMIDDIEDAPTEDVAPVRHAFWRIGEEGEIVCSACGRFSVYFDYEDKLYRTPSGPAISLTYPPYCKHCGAKMDAEEEPKK